MSIGFVATRSDPSLFVLQHGHELDYILLYVDDMIVTASSQSLLFHVINSLQAEFAIKDMGPLKSILGIAISRSSSRFFLTQAAYAKEILERARMSNCMPVATPVDTKAKLPAAEGAKVGNPTTYRSLAGALQYLTVTCPDIAYDMQQACLHMHDPRECHLSLVKRILRYVCGSSQLGLHLFSSPSATITTYSDAD
jgi:hypothetical protein